MSLYGLIGKHLSHSFSPDYFNIKFGKLNIDAEYRLFEIDNVDEILNIINDYPDLRGLNVTIPYKRNVYGLMDELDESVHLTGSINTIKIKRKGKRTILKGYNTDIIGLEKTISPLIKDSSKVRALILGTGGSANSVAYVLRKLGVFFCYASRNPSKMLHLNYKHMDKYDILLNNLIINTTPLGMHPDTDASPDIPYEHISNRHIMYDLIYNPPETLFLKKGREQGAQTYNGQRMLEIQAEASWKIWRSRFC